MSFAAFFVGQRLLRNGTRAATLGLIFLVGRAIFGVVAYYSILGRGALAQGVPLGPLVITQIPVLHAIALWSVRTRAPLAVETAEIA
jgi:hypothetical protein